MSSKRKQKAPQQLTEEKRKCMSWNPFSGSEQIINDIEDVAGPSGQDKKNLSSSDKVYDHLISKKLQTVIDNCAFYIPIYKSLGPLENKLHSCLGQFRIKLLSFDAVLPDCEEFFLYVGNEPQYNMVYFEWEENSGQTNAEVKQILYYMVEITIPKESLDGYHSQSLRFVQTNFDTLTLQLTIHIYLTENGFLHLKCPSEPIRPKKINSLMCNLMKFLFGISVPYFKRIDLVKNAEDIEEFYASLKKLQDQEKRLVVIDVQHPGLRPQLRPYQKQAVQWMLEKEHFIKRNQPETLHVLYEEIKTSDEKIIYYNKHGGFFVRNKPLSAYCPGGGILADEMGLGKTVEVLACLLLHPRTDILRPDFQDVQNETISEVMPLAENEEKKIHVQDSFPPTFNGHSGLNSPEPFAVQHSIKSEISQNERSTVWGTKISRTSSRTSKSRTTQSQNGFSYKNKAYSERQPRAAKLKCLQNLGDLSSDDNSLDSEYYSPQYSSDEKFSNQNSKPKKKSKTTKKRKSKSPARATNGSVGKKNLLNSRKSLYGEVSFDNSDTEDVLFNSFQDILKENINGENESKFRNFTNYVGDSKLFFECVCGVQESHTRSGQVQCNSCNSMQHAHCVNYNLDKLKNGLYYCPHCLVRRPPVQSIASLIISPISICNQWVEEIKKHIHKKALRMFVYGGVYRHGFIQPQTLACYDIVITTYETLRKEIDYVDLPHSNSDCGRRFRHPKRFMAIPSPLIAVEWWRICLDEAQMVECTTTKTAEMALRLRAINRWCVTGTPIQRGVEDLYGLLLFLGIDPVWVQIWWDRLLYEPYRHGIKEPMYDLISTVLWRTTKINVLDQIKIPEQTELIHWLTFSPVEEHFYRHQQADCTRDALQKMNRYQEMDCHLSSLDRKAIGQLLFPLLRLRQACCHPQAVRGQFMPLHKSTMTMEELLESLTKKAKLEAEEAHRKLICALNGLASICVINQEYEEAVETYREAIRSWEEQNDRLKTDDLQKLHALHNLAEILEQHSENIAPTLRDDQLRAQASDLRIKYIEKVGAQVITAEQLLQPAQESVRKLKSQFAYESPWWHEVLRLSTRQELADDIVVKVKNDLMSSANTKVGTIANRFRDIRGLQYVVTTHLDDMEEAHNELCCAVEHLDIRPSQEVINDAIDCHLRPTQRDTVKCLFCQIDGLFQKYESRLFLYQDEIKKRKEDDDLMLPEDVLFFASRQGNWGDCEVEKILKVLLTYARNHIGISSLIEDGNTHIKLMDALKKEFRALRNVWMAHRHQVSALDELHMATTRMRLRFSDEPKPIRTQTNIIETIEIPEVKLRLTSDRVQSEAELTRKLGQLLYLSNLAKADYGKKGGINPESCPICAKQFGTEWSVLQCGHCFCVPCIRILITTYSFGGRRRALKCAICRQISSHEDISYVSTKAMADNEDNKFNIVGSHSTKVEAVVQCLLKIHQEDPEAKSLVFSTWNDVLDVIGKALTQNEITFRLLLASNKFQNNLTSFKQDSDVQALLLPLQSGSKGLNLIEATHVLLVEPVLNPANELQAIGRVHRIGQNKPTFVHRFLVQRTIEERIHKMLKNPIMTPKAKDEDMLTFNDLKNLFEYEQWD